MNIRFLYKGPSSVLADRELLAYPIAEFHAGVLRGKSNVLLAGKIDWTVELEHHLLFDVAGLNLIKRVIESYKGAASRLEFELVIDPTLARDYYSLHPPSAWKASRLKLPIQALRSNKSAATSETLELVLPFSRDVMRLPDSMGGNLPLGVPQALLVPYYGEFDLLFANQIGVLSQLRHSAQRSPVCWINGLGRFPAGSSFPERAALSYRKIHPKARVHSTAVIEGSVIEEGAEIGAYCTVRYSVIGRGARLFDGAKVEFSVVGARSWLMHDLVLFRSCAEEGVFLIHGPYQFSYFQKKSSAFATILMDFRPDEKPIRVKTSYGLQAYGGRFLGSVLGEGAKILGGCLLAPGRIVPPQTWLGPDSSEIHTVDQEKLPQKVPLSSKGLKRRADEQYVS